MLYALLVVILILFLLGGVGPGPRGPYWGTGWYGGGGIGLILVVILIIILLDGRHIW